MENSKLKLWQLNLLVHLLEQELNQKCVAEVLKCGFDSSEKLPASVVERIDELKETSLHEIGKANITLREVTRMRDKLSVDAEKSLTDGPDSKTDTNVQILVNGIEHDGTEINQNFSDVDEAVEWLQQLQEREDEAAG